LGKSNTEELDKPLLSCPDGIPCSRNDEIINSADSTGHRYMWIVQPSSVNFSSMSASALASALRRIGLAACSERMRLR
jgi:hypothetical protein